MQKKFILGVLLIGIVAVFPMVTATPLPYEQDFIISAYYSPKPDQCCYVRGSFEGDTLLNGQGIVGADGTPVYSGMAAAPSSYPFGTTIELPGIGTVTVHDRGGAIIEQEHAHRLDLWMGEGEEGLARALAFGKRHVRGIVHFPGAEPVRESMNILEFLAPQDRLPSMAAKAVPKSLLVVRPSLGESGQSVKMLQEALQVTGYFDHAVTGYFGDVTKNALRAFRADMQLSADADVLDEESALHLRAAQMLSQLISPVEEVGEGSDAASVKAAKRAMRFIGAYSGGVSAEYDAAFQGAVLAYQRTLGLITSVSTPGAGRIGPRTKAAVSMAWKRRRIERKASELRTYLAVKKRLDDEGRTIRESLSEGETGLSVAALQTILVGEHLLTMDDITGFFGQRTKNAVLEFQVKRSLIAGATDPFGGSVGPITSQALNDALVKRQFAKVRGYGWQAW